MSRSILSRLFSRFGRGSSSRASVVSPSLRPPSSRSACLTQLRIVCSDGSNSRASDRTLRPLGTSSTICCLHSGGYRPLLSAMTHLPVWPKGKGVRHSGATPVDGKPRPAPLSGRCRSRIVGTLTLCASEKGSAWSFRI